MNYHIEFNPQTVGEDFRDESLYRAAVSLNRNFPTLFPIESLEFLRELAISLPRRGVTFLGTADKFIFQLATDTISASHSPEAQELLDLHLRKEQAVKNLAFILAAELYARQREIRERGLNLQLVTKERIIAALARDGVIVDNEANGVR